MSAGFAKKRFGQHFLADPDIAARIVALLPVNDTPVLEVGPGRGALTELLARRTSRLVAVEFDRDMVAQLQRQYSGRTTVTIRQHDILTYDPAMDSLDRAAVIGNLPYNISSPMLDWCVKHRSIITTAVFMLQKEMAARVTGSPGSKDWSPLSIMTQLLFEATSCFDVSPRAFIPPPKVQSAVIRLIPKAEVPPVDLDKLSPFLHGCFKQRRKLLLSNLAAMGLGTSAAAELIESTQLSPTIRAEQVTLPHFLDLFSRYRMRVAERTLPA